MSINPSRGFRDYLVITGGYWAFTLTDGAIRMLVALYFHGIGYSPLEIAMLFLFYEFFGVVTNLVGGWIGSRLGLNVTMHVGMALQVIALGMLTIDSSWLTVPYVMFAQALSGIAKDLNKMSAKAGVKLIFSSDSSGKLFRWIAALTGSKNALKGIGFFVGGALLSWIGFRRALFTLATSLFVVFLITLFLLPKDLGRSKTKAKFRQIFSKSRDVNFLSAARFFLFGSRDVWFVVALPVFLTAVLGWDSMAVGAFLAFWVIGYGIVQAFAPRFFRASPHSSPDGRSVLLWTFPLMIIPAVIATSLMASLDPRITLVAGLTVFGVFFAVNSSIHSFLIVNYAEQDKVAMNVGFYYMANAGGRLTGTVLSGWIYQQWGLAACLWCSAGFIGVAGLISTKLPSKQK